MPDPQHWTFAGIGTRKRKLALSLCLLSALSAAMFFLLVPPVWKLKQGPVTLLRWTKSGPQYVIVGPDQSDWLALDKVSRHAIHAIIVAEDARFYEHFGLDLHEIGASISFNLAQGRYARGASTITQQIVKLVFLNSEKSLLRKLREASGAILLEYLLPKESILEWYVNIVDLGDGVFGLKAASSSFFQTTPELLTIQNAAHLAMVLPSPNRWSKALKQQELSAYGHRRFRFIIEQMYRLGFITRSLRESALATGDFGKPIQNQNLEVELPSSTFNSDAPAVVTEPPPFGHDDLIMPTKRKFPTQSVPPKGSKGRE